MHSAFERSPDSLHALRDLVKHWVKRARESVETFYDENNHSFWRDSRTAEEQYRRHPKARPKASPDYEPNPTTTARCFMALAYAARCTPDLPGTAAALWLDRFRRFAQNTALVVGNEGILCAPEAAGDESPLNNFELAHLTDLLFCSDFIQRFYPDEAPAEPLLRKNRRSRATVPLRAVLEPLLSDLSANALWDRGALAMEGDPSIPGTLFGPSRHYFVTLHWLRALAILDPGKQRADVPDDFAGASFVDQIEAYCIEQCFYAQRGIIHLYDPTSLTFAAVIYCLYARNVDPDICQAIVESLAAAQRENGSWPATHPIIRRNGQPWHITSHELALCLTWLYFQPRVPDSARAVLLAMMEQYFRGWVVRTLVHVPNPWKPGAYFRGWFDDHTTARNFVVGWATGIVCHFLSNYYQVLSDHINRRVIETLELTNVAERYLVDATASKRSVRWSKRIDPFEKTSRRLATWSDLPPFAWSAEPPRNVPYADLLRWRWTDPSHSSDGDDKRISTNLALRVILPTLERPTQLPDKNFAAILPGSPGTRKTTLVKAVAELLEWPHVPVPASVIFARGFDHMEARADEVFRLLTYLTGCVVFFDEFEEFFRDRREETGPRAQPAPIHNRTIAAFTTSAMLPRLQDLHDAEQCLIFFATNDIDKVDPAIKRLGRFDFLAKIEHPKRPAIESYLEHPTRKLLEKLKLPVDERTRSIQPKDRRPAYYQRLLTAMLYAVRTVLKEEQTIRFGTVEDAFKSLEKEFSAVTGRQAQREKAVALLKDALAKESESLPDLAKIR